MIEIILIFLQILFLSLITIYSIPVLKYNINDENLTDYIYNEQY